MENLTAHTLHAEAVGCIEKGNFSVEVRYIAPLTRDMEVIEDEVEVEIEGRSYNCTEELARVIAVKWLTVNRAQIHWDVI